MSTDIRLILCPPITVSLRESRPSSAPHWLVENKIFLWPRANHSVWVVVMVVVLACKTVPWLTLKVHPHNMQNCTKFLRIPSQYTTAIIQNHQPLRMSAKWRYDLFHYTHTNTEWRWLFFKDPPSSITPIKKITREEGLLPLTTQPMFSLLNPLKNAKLGKIF